MPRPALLLPSLALLACENSHSSKGWPNITITSPESMSTYDEGDEVYLHVEGSYPDGDSALLEEANWSAGTWVGSGVELTATDLPAGQVNLSVEAILDNRTFYDHVSFSIVAAEDTGDGPPEDTGDPPSDTGGDPPSDTGGGAETGQPADSGDTGA